MFLDDELYGDVNYLFAAQFLSDFFQLSLVFFFVSVLLQLPLLDEKLHFYAILPVFPLFCVLFLYLFEDPFPSYPTSCKSF